MPQFGGKNAKKTKKTSSSSKRHFTVVMGGKEHGLYVSSTPSSAARKAVTKLCTANKSKEVEFYMREITQDSKKKTYGPYEGYIEKLKEPIELKGRVIKYKPVAKLSGKTGTKKGGGTWKGYNTIHRIPEPRNPEEDKRWSHPEDWIDELPESNYSELEKEFIKNYDSLRSYDITRGEKDYESFLPEEIEPERIKVLKKLVHNKSERKQTPPRQLTHQNRRH
jgi:hypothetical protein